jgi:Fe-S-cluster containining protein
MRRPEGILLGKYSVFGNVDPTAFLTKDQLAEVRTRLPEFPGFNQQSTPLRVEPIIQQPTAQPEVKRHLPVVNATGQRDCVQCASPCCMILVAGLTPEEVASGEYEMDGPDAEGRYTLPRPWGRCIYLTKDSACGIYSRRPIVCKSYRCDGATPDRRIDRWLLRMSS